MIPRARRGLVSLIGAILLYLPMLCPAAEFNRLVLSDQREHSVAPLQLPAITGELRKLSDFSGQVIVLAFFATWCPQCNSELPRLTELQLKYAERGFTVIAVSIDRVDSPEVLGWVKAKGLNYPVLHDRHFNVRRSHGIKLIPTVQVLDRRLRLAATVVGEIDWQSKSAAELIDRLLQEPVSKYRASRVADADARPQSFKP